MTPAASPAVPAEEMAILPSVNELGAPVFCVLVKRTYDIRPGRPAARAGRASPLLPVDTYWDDGDAESSTVRHETDMAPYKLLTDVVVIGKAYAPGGQPVAQMDVGVEIAGRRTAICVTGDRRCVHRAGMVPEFTDPAPFTEMEIRYDRAYGGEDAWSDPSLPFSYPRNHRGLGVAVKNIREAVDGLALPNLEDPGDMLTPERVVIGEPDRWNGQPLPRGFGWYQKTWYPRCSFVGAVPGLMDPDTVMREEELGLVPRGQIALARRFQLPSFDVRFNNGASLGLAMPHLAGGESMRLLGLTPSGSLEFSLPADTPRLMLDIGLGQNELPPALHTVCVRMDEMQVDLVWRGAHEYPGIDWLPEMPRMRAEIA